MSQSRPSDAALRVADLRTDAPTPFSLVPDAPTCAALAESLGLLGLRKLRLKGHVRPLGKQDWELTASLGATVTQACTVTLAPVTTRIEAPVTRRFLKDFAQPEGEEVEMPADDESEPLSVWIDPEAVLIEALSLELPAYPRADGAELSQKNFAAPGIAPITDEDTKPFAGLADLREKLAQKKD